MENKDGSKKYDQDYAYIKKSVEQKRKNSYAMILDGVKSGASVLEFGPAAGYMTRYMKEEMNCDVSIVEYDAACAKRASKYAKQTIVGDIETFEWMKPLKGQTFDYITFADVLEHLKDPWAALRECSKFLKPGGKVLISIPNIGHNAVLIDLWNNKFKYRKVGLLDNTHLRFWGYENLDDMFENTPLKRVKTDFVKAKEKATVIKARLSDLPLLLRPFFRFRKHGRVYQFIITAEKA